ncbi:MAG: molybdopterin converting factor subunit 1 [Gemmatimonadetes bacterium]|nr:molybdopterin converting factor subunit 1 [Gemmatimonadota bacterium]
MALVVRTLFFAAHRDLMQTSELAVELSDGSTVGDLIAELRGRGGPFSGLPPDSAVAVNREYVDASRQLRQGDEVAFIPPVAGG